MKKQFKSPNSKSFIYRTAKTIPVAVILIFCFSANSYGQNIGINKSGAKPSSASNT